MGVFDSVMIRCFCGEEVEFQSKAGECLLETFKIRNVPPAIAVDLDGKTERCKCGKTIKIASYVNVELEVITSEDKEET